VPDAGWIPFDPTGRAIEPGNLIPLRLPQGISQIVWVIGSFRD